jgi:hypothetical protein
MKKIALLILIVFPLLSFSQDRKIAAVRIESFPFRADQFVGIDAFGYAYFIDDNTFIKAKGSQTAEFKKISTGKIARADIENPMQIVLFYENFNTVILLDNQLNEISEINFSNLDKPVVAHAAGIASQNSIWIYDSLTQQIGLYDYLKNEFRPLTTPLKENLKFYTTDFNTFRWIDAKLDFYACNIYGKIYPLGKAVDFDALRFASDNAFFFSKNGKLYLHDSTKNEVFSVTDIDNSFKNFYYKDQILSIFTTGGITNYKITLP